MSFSARFHEKEKTHFVNKREIKQYLLTKKWVYDEEKMSRGKLLKSGLRENDHKIWQFNEVYQILKHPQNDFRKQKRAIQEW